ncbi:MAG: hypothetical protein ACRD5Z_00470, partial [Bryobacteraceae bacterium]
GVVFESFGSDGSHFSLAADYGEYFDGYGSNNAPFSNLSTGYQDLLKTGNYGSGNSLMALTISDLTAGDTYQFQVWINDSRGNYGQQGITATDDGLSVHILGDVSGLEAGTGQYALLTFTANANGIETITFMGDSSGGTTEEAFQLRDITGLPSVPEGGPTMSLLAISLMGLLFFRRATA